MDIRCRCLRSFAVEISRVSASMLYEMDGVRPRGCRERPILVISVYTVWKFVCFQKMAFCLRMPGNKVSLHLNSCGSRRLGICVERPWRYFRRLSVAGHVRSDAGLRRACFMLSMSRSRLGLPFLYGGFAHFLAVHVSRVIRPVWRG